MNNISLYRNVKDKRVFVVEVYGLLDVWSIELDEPIGAVTSMDEFENQAIASGWIPAPELCQLQELPA